MYNYIEDPYTGKSYKIETKMGIKILKNYINGKTLKGGLKKHKKPMVDVIVQKIKNGMSKIRSDMRKANYMGIDNQTKLVMRRDVFNKRVLPNLIDLINPDIISDKALLNLQKKNYKTWGIKMGEQIYHNKISETLLGGWGPEDLEHHAIYLGFGLIIEVGTTLGINQAGDIETRLNAGLSNLFKSSSLGIDFLDFLIIRGQGEIHRVIYPKNVVNLDNADDIRKLLNRAIRAIENLEQWNYNIFSHNCQHWASSISTGKEESQFSQGRGPGLGKITEQLVPSFIRDRCQFSQTDIRTERIPIEDFKSETCLDKQCKIYTHLGKGQYNICDQIKQSKNPMDRGRQYCTLRKTISDRYEDSFKWIDENNRFDSYSCEREFPRKLTINDCVPTNYVKRK